MKCREQLILTSVSQASRTKLQVMRVRNPTGEYVQGDFTKSWNFAANTFDEIVGNQLPAVRGDALKVMAQESFRALKPGGKINVFSTSRGLEDVWAKAFQEAGFVNITQNGRKIMGYKPQ